MKIIQQIVQPLYTYKFKNNFNISNLFFCNHWVPGKYILKRVLKNLIKKNTSFSDNKKLNCLVIKNQNETCIRWQFSFIYKSAHQVTIKYCTLLSDIKKTPDNYMYKEREKI